MKTLIFPDIHTSIKVVDEILPQIKNEIGYNKVIYLGDVFDQFHDTPTIAREVAIWYKEKLEDPKNVFVEGNHDTIYRYPKNARIRCSGWDHYKSVAINDVLNQSDWNKVKLYHVDQNIMFSHAGVSKGFLDYIVNLGKSDSFEYTLQNVCDKLDQWNEEAVGFLKMNYSHFLYEADYTRGGNSEWAGPVWCDASRFVPTPHFTQVFAHSPHKHPEFKFNSKHGPIGVSVHSNALWHDADNKFAANFGLCLDTHLRNFAILDNGTLSIYEISMEVFGMSVTSKIGKKVFERNLNPHKYS
jgi:hypothetical protein